MAGGLLSPYSVDFGTSGDLAPFLYQGGGGNAAPNEWGVGVIASLANDRTLGLRFRVPNPLPSGLMKMDLVALSDAVSGAAKFTVSDGKATPSGAPSATGNKPSAVALTSDFVFTVTSANATVGATYTNNGQTFTVLQTLTAGTTLLCSGTGAPLSSGTLTKATGTGDATIAFSILNTLTWAASENTGAKEMKVGLSAAPAAGDIMVVAVKFQTSGWTLASKSCWQPFLTWE